MTQKIMTAKLLTLDELKDKAPDWKINTYGTMIIYSDETTWFDLNEEMIDMLGTKINVVDDNNGVNVDGFHRTHIDINYEWGWNEFCFAEIYDNGSMELKLEQLIKDVGDLKTMVNELLNDKKNRIKKLIPG